MARTAAGRRRERAGDIKLSITPSGKVIWRDKYPTEYKGWSAGDHLYAAIIHEANRTQGGEIARAHRALAGESRAISPADVAEARRTGASLVGRRSHATKKAADKDLEKALADRLGFIPTEKFILRAQGEWAGFTLDSLRSEERKMTRKFEKQGGRGVDLADEIDMARTALALVDSGFLIKGDLGILKVADRERPKLKSDFDY